MNLDNITPQGYILAMIIRDDGERILLGDGAYVFKDSQQHFQPNTFANDVVELQGTDGQLLAGQVRRTAIQTFAGYIGDASTSQQRVEQYRKQFLMFFRKKFHYTAVYIFHDGSAIQRKRGYIAAAPAVPELYQKYPEWSVGLNFEDANYYEYAEDDEGNEIYAHAVQIAISNAVSGGLIWDNNGATSDELGYTGTPIDGNGKNFQLTNTSDKILKSTELLGDATQKTYTGKNLLPIMDGTTTFGNLTFTVADGVLTINGTSNAAGHVKLTNGLAGASSIQASWLSETMPATDLNGKTMSLDYESGTPTTSSCAFRIYGSSSTHIAQWYPSTTDQKTTFSQSNTPSCFAFFFNSGLAFTNYKVKLQLETGSAQTSFEPYVGGTASPNPDYPQAVNVVTGEQTVSITGKNLFDYASASDTANTTVTQYRVFAISGLAPNGRYTMGGQTVQQITDSSKYVYFWSADTYSGSERKVSLKSASTVTFDANADGEIYLAIYPTDTATWTSILSNHFTNAQLEFGNQASSFEPYQGRQTKPVNLGKNLFDGIIEQGGFDGSGLDINAGNRVRTKNYIPVQPNTKYTIKGFSWDTTKGAILGASISYYSVNDYTTARLSYQNWVSIGVEQGYTLTTPANCHYIRFLLTVGATAGASTAVTPADIGEVQLELGSKPTSYSAYFTPIELAKIGTYQDRIYNDSGKWYLHKEIGKVVLDGTENWAQSSTQNTGYFRAYNTTKTWGTPNTGQFIGRLNFMSDYFQSNGGGLDDAQQYLASTGYASYAKIYDSIANSVDSFKTWLGTHNTSVYYVLATPYDTEITNQALIDQLNSLQHANTYTDLTNFSTSSVYLNGFLSVEAYPKGGTPTGGYIWEAGGAGGPTTLTVDGVDNAYPIWTVPGPATNPTLTNITTGQTISWTGTVPNGQELVIDMANQTASLSGANVFEFVSGSWLTLEPGNNRISYSAINATDPSKLEWNGVTG